MTIKQMKALLKGRLQNKRYDHCIQVMETAAHLAKIHGVDKDAAEIAGLLHDYAKNMSPEELRQVARELEVELDPVVCRHMMLAHGPIGAAMVQRDLGISEPEILDAIRYHTYGRVGMGPLEKIIYLADFIEPGRKFKGAEELRKTALDNLDKAVLMALESSLLHLVGSDRLMHPNTLLARNELIIEQNARRHHGLDTGTGKENCPPIR